MLQTHVNNDIYNKYCLIHNSDLMQNDQIIDFDDNFEYNVFFKTSCFLSDYSDLPFVYIMVALEHYRFKQCSHLSSYGILCPLDNTRGLMFYCCLSLHPPVQHAFEKQVCVINSSQLYYYILKRIHVGISNIIYSEQSLFIYDVSA